MKHFIGSLFLAVILLSSCKKDDTKDSNGAQTMLSVSYGTNAQQKMDVYLPAGRSSTTTKAMILIHGGGWNTCNKTDFNEYVDTLKKRALLCDL